MVGILCKVYWREENLSTKIIGNLDITLRLQGNFYQKADHPVSKSHFLMSTRHTILNLLPPSPFGQRFHTMRNSATYISTYSMYCIPKSTGHQLATSTIRIDSCELFFYFLFFIYLCKHSMYAHPVSCRALTYLQAGSNLPELTWHGGWDWDGGWCGGIDDVGR